MSSIPFSRVEKVSDNPKVYSAKRPSKEKIREAIRLLVEGRVRQIALYYPREHRIKHLYRDRRGGFKLIDSGEKQPNPRQIDPSKINVDELGEPYELLLFV